MSTVTRALPGAATEILWHRLPAAAVLDTFASTEAGLSTAEAARRLALHGPNALREVARTGSLRIFLRQFRSLLVGILVVAGIVSGILGEFVDCVAILAIVLLNAGIGFYQEYSAERSIAALRQLTAPRATVRRDGTPRAIPAVDLVVGDVLALQAGDLVAADARLLNAASLLCIESALTGESEAVTKNPDPLPAPDLPLGDRENMVFMGTSIAGGTAHAVVVATGMATELGRIAELMEVTGAHDATPLQRKLAVFGRLLVWVTLAAVGLLFGLGLLRGTRPLELFMTSVSLAVAAVPEGLPAVVTVALALGVSRMARRGALVRRLPAVETLGSTTVICTDKTGTLTLGQMTVRAFQIADQRYAVTGEGYGPEGQVLVQDHPADAPQRAALRPLAVAITACNNAHLVHEAGTWGVLGDPTEGALLAAGAKAGADRELLDRELPRHHALPFDSDRKRGTVIRRTPEGTLRAFVNGAPGPLLLGCSHHLAASGVQPLTEADRARILADTVALARESLRVLASAYRDLPGTTPVAELTPDRVERDLVFVGLTGMWDPPRPTARDAVARCQAAGIRVVMITGDHPETATAIARDIGIASDRDGTVTGAELDRLSEEELRGRVPAIAVYARVTAEHKLRVVRAWKANEAVVAMTGDGVNDAPAIRGADIGIAMGRSGTEVTRQASDMILTDDNFATIVAAVEEGRGIYDNIRKTLQYLLAGNTGEILLLTFCVVPGLPPALVPIHLLWINLVTDGLPALCLAVDPIDPEVMKRPPRGRSERLTDGAFLRAMGLTGLLTAAVAFAVYLWVLRTGSLELARTEAFAVLVYSELFRAFGSRSATTPVWRIPILSNPLLAAVVAVSCGLQVWSHHSSLLGGFLKTVHVPLLDEAILFALGTLPLLALEGIKWLRNRRVPGAAPATGQG